MEGLGPEAARGARGGGHAGSGCSPSTEPATRDSDRSGHHAGPSPHQRHPRRCLQTHGHSSPRARSWLGSAWEAGRGPHTCAPRVHLGLPSVGCGLPPRGEGGPVPMAEVQSGTPQARPRGRLARPSGPWGPARRSPGCRARSLGRESTTLTSTAWKRNGRKSSILAAKDLGFFAPFLTTRLNVSHGGRQKPPAAFRSSPGHSLRGLPPVGDSKVQDAEVRTTRSRAPRSGQ